MDVVAKAIQAQNDRDIEAFASCIAEGYTSATPLHPERNYVRREHARDIWAKIFEFTTIVDSRALTLLAFPSDVEAEANGGQTVVLEIDCFGRNDHTGYEMKWRGVIFFGVMGGSLRWGRSYLELDESGQVPSMGAGLEAVLERD